MVQETTWTSAPGSVGVTEISDTDSLCRPDGLDFSVEGKAAHAADAAVKVANIDAVAGDIDFLDDDFAGGDDDGGVSDVGIFEAGTNDFIARLVLVSHQINIVMVRREIGDGGIHVEKLFPGDVLGELS